MKILLFSYLFPNSKLPGRGIFNLSRAKALINAGCEVVVVAPVSVNPNLSGLLSLRGIKEQFVSLKNLNSIPEFEIYDGIKVYHPKWITAPRKYFWKYLPNILHFFIGKRLDKIINDFKPDLIISTWLNPFSAYGKYFKGLGNLKHFAIAEGSDLLIQPFLFKGWEKIEKCINENSDFVIAVSEKMKTRMEMKTGLKNINLIRNGFDESIFTFNKDDDKTRNKYFRIVTVANFNYEKGHDILLAALQNINIPFKLTLVGNGPLLNKYKKLVEQCNLQEYVKFTGHIPHKDLPGILRNHDLFCLPSRSEGLPAAPLEAMACGLPVVAANVGGMDEIVKDGFNGFLFKPECNEELAENLIKAFQTIWNNREISIWVTNNFSWSTWAAKIINSYESNSQQNTMELIGEAVV